jgi:hypothetical protein
VSPGLKVFVLAGSGLAGSGLAGSGLAGSGLAGSGLAGSGLAGSDWLVRALRLARMTSGSEYLKLVCSSDKLFSSGVQMGFGLGPGLKSICFGYRAGFESSIRVSASLR